MEDNLRDSLIREALRAREYAYAPYSGYRVGAAALTQTNDVFIGCNVENASFGLTICAERAAACSAMAAGSRSIAAMAVVASGAPAPCGACRQFLLELGPSMIMLMVDADDPQFVRQMTLDELLPEHFRLGDAE
jgi:cytidine deaminase